MIIATSCFISLASGASAVGVPFIAAIVIVCLLNMMAAASVAELNAIMPNLTGGLAQYMLAGLGPLVTIVTMTGGYIISNIFAAPAEGAMFANVMCEFIGHNIPPAVYSVSMTILLVLVNLRGVNMSAALTVRDRGVYGNIAAVFRNRGGCGSWRRRSAAGGGSLG